MEFTPIISRVAADPVVLTYSLSVGNIVCIALAVIGIACASVMLTAIKVLSLKPQNILSSMR